MPQHLEPRPVPAATARKSWTPPQIEDLPSLENVTLETSIPGDAAAGPILPADVK